MTHCLATIRDALYSVHPDLPWLTLTAAIFATQWLVRRYAPTLWLRVFAWLPDDAEAGLRRVVQALPSVVAGAAIPALASGGDVWSAVLGAVCGALAPISHHVLRAVPFVPYRGELGRDAKPPVPPVLLLVGALLTAPHVTACSPQQPAQTALVQRAGVVAFESSVAAYAIALDAETRRVEGLVAGTREPTQREQVVAQGRLERLERAEAALRIARAWLSGEASDADGKRAIGDASTLLVVLLEELAFTEQIPRYIVDGAKAAQAFAAAGGAL